MGLPATALLMVYASVQCDWQAAWARTVVGPAHDEGDEEQRQEHEDEPCASAGAGGREPWREVRTRRVSAVSVLRAPARRSTVAVTRARRLALAQAARLMQRGAT